MTGFTYIASPYTHEDMDIRIKRYKAVCLFAAERIRMGECVYCPIAHSSSIDHHGKLDSFVDGDLWKKQDIAILRHASRMYVYMLEGWKESKGVEWEIEMAKALNIPIAYINP